MTLKDQLIRDERPMLKPYLDCCGKPWRECFCLPKGKLTIGTGRNLDDVGISMDENDYFLDHDIARASASVLARVPFAVRLDEGRRAVLIAMAFNLGIGGLLGFRLMLAAVERGDWDEAAREMLDSRWAKQVGKRSERLAEQMITGVIA